MFYELKTLWNAHKSLTKYSPFTSYIYWRLDQQFLENFWRSNDLMFSVQVQDTDTIYQLITTVCGFKINILSSFNRNSIVISIKHWQIYAHPQFLRWWGITFYCVSWHTCFNHTANRLWYINTWSGSHTKSINFRLNLKSNLFNV